MNKRLAAALVAVAAFAAVIAGGVTVQTTGGSQCVKPVAIMLATDEIPMWLTVERWARANTEVPPAWQFDYSINSAPVYRPGRVELVVMVGNGWTESFFGSGFLGKTALFDATLVRDCQGDPWRVTRWQLQETSPALVGRPSHRD